MHRSLRFCATLFSMIVVGGWFPTASVTDVCLVGPGEAAAQYRRRTPHARKRIALQLRRRAARRIAKGKYKAAINDLRRSHRTYPAAQTLLMLGRAYQLAGNQPEARRAYRRLPTRFKRNLAKRLRRRGSRGLAAARYKSAISDLSLSNDLAPSPDTELMLGQCLELAGRTKEATEVYQRLLRTLKPSKQRDAVEQRLASLSPGPDTGKPSSQPASLPVETGSPGDQRDAMIFGGDSGDSRDAALLGGDTTTDGSGQSAPTHRLADKFEIGAQFHFRLNMEFTDSSDSQDHSLSMPNLADFYVDGRPNDRVRGFIRAHLGYDPTSENGEKVDIALREFWLKFDIARRLFVTLGKQMARWGTTWIWNPVDVINLERRPILSPLDLRSGIPMLKLHWPIESLAWNVYAAGLLFDLNSFDRAGVIGRFEFVFSTVEVGVIGIYRDSIDPRVGMDVSAGVWVFDLASEVSITIGDQHPNNMAAQVSAAIQSQIGVFNEDVLVLGGEYFYNQLGSSESNVADLFTGAKQGFYLARHYGAIFAALPAPGRLDDWSFALRAIGNLSDSSFATQLIVGVKVLALLNVQLLVTGHFGRQGELRIGDSAFNPEDRAAFRRIFNPDHPGRLIPTQTLDVGLWLSVEI